MPAPAPTRIWRAIRRTAAPAATPASAPDAPTPRVSPSSSARETTIPTASPWTPPASTGSTRAERDGRRAAPRVRHRRLRRQPDNPRDGPVPGLGRRRRLRRGLLGPTTAAGRPFSPVRPPGAATPVPAPSPPFLRARRRSPSTRATPTSPATSPRETATSFLVHSRAAGARPPSWHRARLSPSASRSTTPASSGSRRGRGSEGQLQSCPKSGPCSTPNLLATGLTYSRRARRPGRDRVLQRGLVRGELPVAGCAGAPMTIATGLPAPFGIAVDAANVYFTNYTSVGTVQRCPLAGCSSSPETVLSGLSFPAAIAVDAKAVYVANYGVVDGSGERDQGREVSRAIRAMAGLAAVTTSLGACWVSLDGLSGATGPGTDAGGREGSHAEGDGAARCEPRRGGRRPGRRIRGRARRRVLGEPEERSGKLRGVRTRLPRRRVRGWIVHAHHAEHGRAHPLGDRAGRHARLLDERRHERQELRGRCPALLPEGRRRRRRHDARRVAGRAHRHRHRVGQRVLDQLRVGRRDDVHVAELRRDAPRVGPGVCRSGSRCTRRASTGPTARSAAARSSSAPRPAAARRRRWCSARKSPPTRSPRAPAGSTGSTTAAAGARRAP